MLAVWTLSRNGMDAAPEKDRPCLPLPEQDAHERPPE